MALEICFWEPDGPNGETMHHALRIKRLVECDDAMRLFHSQMHKGSIVRITLDRTDKQSPWSRELWIKPGYVDPFAV